MADYLSQVEQVTRSIANMYLGENDETPEDGKVRTEFIKNLAADMLPFISWNKYEEMLKSSKVKVTEQLDLDKNNNDNSGSDGNVDDEFL